MAMLLYVPMIVVLAAVLGALAPQARKLVVVTSDALGALLKACSELSESARAGIWEPVKPHQPVDPLQVFLGLALLVGAGMVVSANLGQLSPMVAFFIPAPGAETALALAIVVMGSTLGVLLHAIPERRWLFSGVGLLLVAGVGAMNWKRAELIVDNPDVSTLLLATVFPVMLQVAEVVTVFGGLHLAGSVLPVIAAAPVLLGVGVVSMTAHLLVAMRLDAALGGVLNALIDACEHLFSRLVRVVVWLTPAERAQRRQAKRVLHVKHDSEFNEVHATIDLDRQREHAARAVEEQRIVAAAAHQRALDQVRYGIDLEVAEAEARADAVNESQIHAKARDRKAAAATKVVEKFYSTIERVALEVADESAPQIKAEALNQIGNDPPAPSTGIAAAVRGIYRVAGYFGARDGSNNHPKSGTGTHKETVN